VRPSLEIIVDVTLVVPHYGAEELTRACLSAIRATTPADVEIIVVDNGTGTEFDAQTIRNETNRGYAVACNQGVHAATTDFVLLLNNDTEPRPGWLPPLVRHMEDPAVAAVAGVALDREGRSQEWLPGLHRDHRGLMFSVPEECAGREAGPVRFLPGFALLLRKAAFEEVGGFDEAYWNGHEDIDLMLALEDAGWKLIYEPSSRVMHHVSAGGYERWVQLRANRERLTSKWAGRATVDVQLPRPPLLQQLRGKVRSVVRLAGLRFQEARRCRRQPLQGSGGGPR
jgi:GT2 family glycosyltransferase